MVKFNSSIVCGEYHRCEIAEKASGQVWVDICRLDCVKPPKHILEPTVINSPHSQEFMVSRIFSVVLILLEPLLDEFTL